MKTQAQRKWTFKQLGVLPDPLRYLHHRFFPKSQSWYPFLGIYYLTYACEFRCPYCSNGSGIPYPDLKVTNLPAEQVVAVLKRMRLACNNLELTGGEPLLHPQFSQVLLSAYQLRFKQLVLTTNGYHLQDYMDDVTRMTSTLVISLDTLDKERAMRWYGGSDRLHQVLANIRDSARLMGKRLVVSAVVTPENIADLMDVYSLCLEIGCTFACYPQLIGTQVKEELRDSEDYKKWYQYLCDQKRSGRPIYATLQALEWMRDLVKFPCHPFTLFAVDPAGNVMYPCLEIGHNVGQILEHNLHDLRQRGLERFGPQPHCGNQCHSACSLGFSSILEHPMTMWYEK